MAGSIRSACARARWLHRSNSSHVDVLLRDCVDRMASKYFLIFQLAEMLPHLGVGG